MNWKKIVKVQERIKNLANNWEVKQKEKNSLISSKVISGGHTDRQTRQAGDFIGPLSFFESRLKRIIKFCGRLV
jgi:hypothetical protein